MSDIVLVEGSNEHNVQMVPLFVGKLYFTVEIIGMEPNSYGCTWVSPGFGVPGSKSFSRLPVSKFPFYYFSPFSTHKSGQIIFWESGGGFWVSDVLSIEDGDYIKWNPITGELDI